MMSRFHRIVMLLALGFLASSARADSQGIEVNIRAAQIRIAPATAGALRLSVSYVGDERPRPSIFLADTTNQPTVAWERITDGDLVGIQSAAGQLLVDPTSGHWVLRDASGKSIVGGDIGNLTDDNKTQITVDRSNVEHFYGSGDVAGKGPGKLPAHLLHTFGKAEVAGGRAAVPYYWSTAGYAAMVIGRKDNSPASWDGRNADSLTWSVAGPCADLYLMPAGDLYAAARAYAELSGFPVVPPRWTFGYLQCRWGWKDKAYIDDTMKQFVDRNLPVDAFIFDFEWFTPQPDYEVKPQGRPDYQDFSWNPLLFPDPANQIAELKKNGIHFVAIRKPRLGNSDRLVMMRRNGWGLPPGGRPEDARCMNFANADCRDWYAKELVPLLRAGIDGWWDDEGEITVSTYYWWNYAQAQALAMIDPSLRLWTVDRSFEPGLQRFGAAAWTGDIDSDWPTLARVPAQLLNWSLAGMDYGTCDIGGFQGNDTPELLTRWMQMGVFMPVMRSHSVYTVVPRFPWLYGPEAEDAIRKALDLRYRMIPYYYSLAHQAYETGAPIMRPLVMEFPADEQVADLTDQWLIGRGVMAAPILNQGGSRSVYLPGDTWYAFGSGEPLAGNRVVQVSAALDQIPMYVRAGTILPLGPVIQHTDQLPGGDLEVQVYPGKDADFTLVEDDGLTKAYLDGQIRRTAFHWDDAGRRLSWTISGPYQGKDIFTAIKVVVFDQGGAKIGQGSLDSSGNVVIGP